MSVHGRSLPFQLALTPLTLFHAMLYSPGKSKNVLATKTRPCVQNSESGWDNDRVDEIYMTRRYRLVIRILIILFSLSIIRNFYALMPTLSYRLDSDNQLRLIFLCLNLRLPNLRWDDSNVTVFDTTPPLFNGIGGFVWGRSEYDVVSFTRTLS